MNRRSIASEVAMGALGALLVVALAMAFVTFTPLRVKAALPSDDPACVTIASDLKAIHDIGATIETWVYAPGADARAMLKLLAELGAPEVEAWGGATSVLLMIGGPNVEPQAMLKFFGDDGCFFHALGTDLNGARIILQRMGTPA